MGVPEVRASLADGRFSGGAAAQRVEAAAAIRFLYEVVLERHGPRGALDGTVDGDATHLRGKQKPVYLNGRQQGVKLVDASQHPVTCLCGLTHASTPLLPLEVRICGFCVTDPKP